MPDPLVVLLIVALAGAAALALGLGLSLRRARRERDRAVEQLSSRRDELEGALRAMVDPVFAVDVDSRLTIMNDAAARLLNTQARRAIGHRVEEVIASQALCRFIAAMLAEEHPIESDMELQLAPAGDAGAPPEPRLFQVQGAVLRDSAGRRIGSLLVLHDVTRLRRLEVVRQDFVANASHEIKTPVTAIKAAAETLLDADTQDPEDTRHLLGIVIRQSDRLQAIVEDLLSLARIEKSVDQDRVAVEPGRVIEVLKAAVETSAAGAAQRRTTVQIDCPPDLTANINAPLLEQAVVNLVDNAIKYSPEGSTVVVRAHRVGPEMAIHVQDNGLGIAAEHLPRIFERFYRTDKARSRALGGTGLGLSIVKHIVLAHGGRITVDSTVGQGSTFNLFIPAGQ
jgi:two-component system phosphate regulon sensor histidine kinase PhoR